MAQTANAPSGLLQGADGNIYGTTYGKGVGYGIRSGSIFKITPGGALTTLDVFCPTSNCSNGTSPSRGWLWPPMGLFTASRIGAEHTAKARSTV